MGMPEGEDLPGLIIVLHEPDGGTDQEQTDRCRKNLEAALKPPPSGGRKNPGENVDPDVPVFAGCDRGPEERDP